MIPVKEISSKTGLPELLIITYITSQPYLAENKDYYNIEKDFSLISPKAIISLTGMAGPDHYCDIADMVIKMHEDGKAAHETWYQDELTKYIAAFPQYLKSSVKQKSEGTDTQTIELLPSADSPANDMCAEQTADVKDTDSSQNETTSSIKDSTAVLRKVPSILKQRAAHIGYKNKTKCGMEAVCVQYHTTKETVVRFKDGTVRCNVQFVTLKTGEVSHTQTKFDKQNTVKALFGYSFTHKCYISDDGNIFDNIRSLCGHYDLSYDCARQAIATYHITFSEYLAYKNSGSTKNIPEYFALADSDKQIHGKEETTKKNKKVAIRENAGDSDIGYNKAVWNTASKIYGADSTEAPSFSDSEKEWACEVYNLMQQENCRRYSHLRKQVYEYMRDNYGIVLQQSLKEYMMANNITQGEPVSYFRVVTQTPQLASIFKSILEDVANGTLDLIPTKEKKYE